jgi:hypothetical protein
MVSQSRIEKRGGGYGGRYFSDAGLSYYRKDGFDTGFKRRLVGTYCVDGCLAGGRGDGYVAEAEPVCWVRVRGRAGRVV